MGPIHLTYDATPLRLAASLGSDVARNALAPAERETLDDAFSVLMSCSDAVIYDSRFDFGPPLFWPYSLESAMRMAVAAFRTYLDDWDSEFAEKRELIPDNVPNDFLGHILGTVGRWLVDPASYKETNHEDLYTFIKDNVCLD